MKHVMYGGKSLLMDDDTTDMLMEYAGSFTPEWGSDTVKVRAISPDGNEVEVTFLLNGSTELIAETTDSHLTLPPNHEAVAYMRGRIETIRHPPTALIEPAGPLNPSEGFDEFGEFDDLR